MAIPWDIRDREHQKFYDDGFGNVTVRTGVGAGMLGPETHTGSDLVGNELTCTITPKQVILERQNLIPVKDYSLIGTKIIFVVPVNPEDNIVVYG